MTYKQFAVSFTVLLAFLLPLRAQAEGFEAGFGFGLIEFDDELGGETEARFDGRFGYYLTDSIEIEGQVIRGTSVLDLTLTAYMVNGVFNFNTDRQVVPYFLLGVGSANVDITPLFGISVDDDALAYQAAIGARYYFGRSQRFAVRLELSGLGEETFDESSVHLSLAAGMTWRFGN